MMGIYPVGSFVMLDSDELGIVVESHAVLLKRPRTLVISDAQGHPVRPFVAALSKRDENGHVSAPLLKHSIPTTTKSTMPPSFTERRRGSGEASMNVASVPQTG